MLNDFLEERNISPSTANFWEIEEDHFRAVFPHRDVYGDIVTTIGRALYPEMEPKYYHPPFPKKCHLFGLYQNKETIWQSGKAILVEGPLDVILAWQNGLKTVVSCLGTALSEEQAILLSRYTNQVVVLPDEDKSGELARPKWINQLETIGIRVDNVRLGHKDLDEAMREGKERLWKQL